MPEAEAPATEDLGGGAAGTNTLRRRRCDNCGARLRGRFCVRCGQRDARFGLIQCENCGAEKQGLFCAVCGQNDRNYRRSIFPVVGEVLAETFETDSRLVATSRVLFTRPGFLSTEFSENRRARYLPPFRLYLFTSIVFFFILSISIDLPDGPPRGPDGEGAPAFLQTVPEDAPGLARRARIRALGEDVEIDADEGGAGQPRKPPELTPEQEEGIERLQRILDEGRQRKLRELVRRPLVGQGIVGTLENIEPEAYASIGETGRYVIGQLVDVLHRPWDAAKAWLENLPVAMFCLLPIYALLLKVIYIRRRRFYSEHLVFGMHIHTVAYLVFSVLVLIPDDVGVGWLSPLLLLALAVYYFLALKRYYGDGGFVTTVKYFVLAFAYFWLLMLALLGAAGAVLLLF